MVETYSTMPIQWVPLIIGSPESSEDLAHSRAMERRLARILASWEGTPYMAGQGLRGVAADCVRSMVSIICEWVKQPVPELETLPNDAAMHTRRGAIRSMYTIRRKLPPHKRVRVQDAKTVRPGDILVTGARSGGPGHAIIVGPQRNTLWHATSTGFNKCGWALPLEYTRLMAVIHFLHQPA